MENQGQYVRGKNREKQSMGSENEWRVHKYEMKSETHAYDNSEDM